MHDAGSDELRAARHNESSSLARGILLLIEFP